MGQRIARRFGQHKPRRARKRNQSNDRKMNESSCIHFFVHLILTYLYRFIILYFILFKKQTHDSLHYYLFFLYIFVPFIF